MAQIIIFWVKPRGVEGIVREQVFLVVLAIGPRFPRISGEPLEELDVLSSPPPHTSDPLGPVGRPQRCSRLPGNELPLIHARGDHHVATELRLPLADFPGRELHVFRESASVIDSRITRLERPWVKHPLV